MRALFEALIEVCEPSSPQPRCMREGVKKKDLSTGVLRHAACAQVDILLLFLLPDFGGWLCTRPSATEVLVYEAFSYAATSV